MKRLIFFRKTSVFNAIFFTLFLLTVLSTSASAGEISATSYDLYNGGIGGYGNVTFYDDTYTGTGSKTTPYAWLSGGLGDLTDGTVATHNWSDCGGASPCTQYNAVYVAWPKYGGLTFLPFITFHFAPNTNIDEVKISMMDYASPSEVDFSMGGTTKIQTVTPEYSAGNNSWYDFTGLGLSGNSLTLTFNYNQSPPWDWLFVSEVEFYGSQTAVPEPATMLLLGSGLIGLAGYGRKKFFKK